MLVYLAPEGIVNAIHPCLIYTIFRHSVFIMAIGPGGVRTHNGHGWKSLGNLTPKRFQFENHFFDFNPT